MSGIAAKLKTGGPLLVYLYYALDNRPRWFRLLWKASNLLRMLVSRFSPRLKFVTSQIIAVSVYWPLARFAALVEKASLPVNGIPLSAYRDKSFYVMRTDAYDRFCTSLEKRFTKAQINDMFVKAGFEQIKFSEIVPFWCAVGIKK